MSHNMMARDLPAWDLNDLFSAVDDPKIENDFTSLEKDIAVFVQNYKKKLEQLDAKGLGKAIKDFENIEEKIGKISSYARLLHAGDLVRHGAFFQKTRERLTSLSTPLVFFTLEVNDLPDNHLKAIFKQEDPALSRYRPWVEDLRRYRPFQLSQESESLLHEKSVTGRAAWIRLFDETESALRFTIEGKECTLSTTLNYMSNPSRPLRREAAYALGEVLQKNMLLFTSITNVLAKDKHIEDGLRGFLHPISSRNLANQVEDSVVDQLVSSVKNAYPRLSHRYYQLKARWMGQDKLVFYDRNAPLPEQDERMIDWSEARETVLDAWQDFSQKMTETGAVFFDKNWIDVPPRDGKASGAFAHPCVPSCHPYLLLNYHAKPRDVMILAHELGHGVHQTLAAKQGYLLADTPLTLAETASVFGEMLVFRALLKKCQTPKQRRVMLAEKIEDMLNTVVRQISFLHFEMEVHDRRRKNELSEAELKQIWLDTNRDSLGPSISWDEEIYGTYWAYIPHFIHSPFYVYAYAFGDCLVNALYARYLEGLDGFEDKYLTLLAAGGSKSYRELLAPFELDPSRPDFWQTGLTVIEKMIDELEGLLDEA